MLSCGCVSLWTDPLPADGKMHRYCLVCKRDGVKRLRRQDKIAYHCSACGHGDERAIYFHHQICWLDDDRELWHAAAGVFVRDPAGKFLFYKRTEYPFVLTVPAGHIDEGETPEAAARRELHEETGLRAGNMQPIGTDEIADPCSGGANYHRWHAYLADTDHADVKILEEGETPVWLSLHEALRQELAAPVRWVVEHYEESFSNRG